MSRGNFCPATSICLFWPTGQGSENSASEGRENPHWDSPRDRFPKPGIPKSWIPKRGKQCQQSLSPKQRTSPPRSSLLREKLRFRWQAPTFLGNGSGILFREYCFGEKNSLSLSEFWANSVSSAKNSVSSLWHTDNKLRGTH